MCTIQLLISVMHYTACVFEQQDLLPPSQDNYLFIRYLITYLAVPFKQPSRYIYDTRDTHAAVAHPHMHLDPYKWYYINGTTRIPVHLRVYYLCIPLKPANLRVGHPFSHSTTSSLYMLYFPYLPYSGKVWQIWRINCISPNQISIYN